MENEIKGGSKYYSFGLRKEWLHQLLAKEEDFFSNNTLGPRQLDAFLYFLRDCQLIDKKEVRRRYFEMTGREPDLIYSPEESKTPFWWTGWVSKKEYYEYERKEKQNE